MTAVCKSLLVLGGARSGKSAYAQKLAEESCLSPLLIATARAFDDEMRQRIALHKAARDTRWRLIEAPLALSDALLAATRPDTIMLVDCLTLWLSNLLLENAGLDAECSRLRRLLKALRGPVIFVSNEVGLGIVPENALGRQFRDAQGRLNQDLAAACDAVVLMSAGVPLQLKPQLLPQLFFGPASPSPDCLPKQK